ncbi:histidine kinase dimerization/phospho-acceptor domain-containing protein [Arvimicrobium flavum]|uniref:histidine kinase dimerization/phospho-acceptor domain-containing protein n=1 Tax=Arvimicrobium flavum TaxID=3393320 RepID=UPI00237B6039|nr:histidine kinase dimerization/phospho-acceptor domain-containing protein [Mesorhizobium shangrilense]
MAAETHSFIDIAALDDVRRHFASGDATVILTLDLTQVIWCNGPGASLLGFSGIETAIGAESGLSRQARRQIESLPAYPEIGKDRPVSVRLAAGMISQITAFRASRIALPGGEAAIMLLVPFDGAASHADTEIAAHAIEGFEDPSNYLALLGANGQRLAVTRGFEKLGIGRVVLDKLIADVATERDRLLKRLVRIDGRAMPVGFARLSEDPARYLLITVDDRQTEADDLDSTPAGVVDDSQAMTTIATEPAAGAPAGASSEVAAAPGDHAPGARSTQAEPTPVATGSRPSETGDGETEATAAAPEPPVTPAAPPPSQLDRTAPAPAASHHDSWYFSAENDAAGASPVADTQAGESAAGKAAFEPNPHAAPLRFVWRTDSEGRFSSISPEFVAAVGADTGDLIGRSFADIARRLALDPKGEIAGLLERRDTWSGRSVLWPIAGTALRAPVDLAALPAYDRDRQFEGFRGFGVARMGEAVQESQEAATPLSKSADTGHDASEPGSTEPVQAATSDEPATEGRHSAPSPQFDPEQPEVHAEDSFRGETPALEIGAKPGRRFTDKVISLAEHRTPANDKGLTPLERSAFREIGEQLKRSSQAAAQAAKSDATPPASTGGSRDDAPEAAERSLETQPDRNPVPSPADRPETEPEVAEPAAPSPRADERPSEADRAPAGAKDEVAETRPAEEAATPAARVSRSLLDFASAAEPGADEEASLPAASDVTAATSGDGETPRQAEAAAPQTPGVARIAIKDEGFMPSAFAERRTGGRRADTSILAQLPIPVLIHSGDTLHYANEALLSLTGYGSIDELAAAGGLDALLSGPVEGRNEGDNRVMLTTRDGSEIPVCAYLQSVPWLGGKALLLTLIRPPAAASVDPAVATVEDEELQARVAELRTILDTATDGVVLIDNDGNVRSISRPAEALFGYDSDQVAGKPFASLFAIESQRAAGDYLAGLAGHGVASVLNDGREVIGREAQGRFIPLFMTIGRLPGNTGYCAVLRDITQWKRAEEDLVQARAQAERTSSQKSDFLARVSHEIRTPLNAIIGFSELMLDEKFGPVANDRYRDYLRDINRSGNHVLDLVNDLLDISKIEAGQQEMDYEAVALNDALAETVALMQPQANRERVIIRSSFASKLPEVVADLRSVRQIALNILSNAVRYTQAGGQVIVSTAHEPNGEVVMRVRDTGVGMTQAEIEQALKPFKQVNALKRARGDGTGLGLPLTKAMVEANRAKFSIFSTPGEGTLVEVAFPSTRVLAE